LKDHGQLGDVIYKANYIIDNLRLPDGRHYKEIFEEIEQRKALE